MMNILTLRRNLKMYSLEWLMYAYKHSTNQDFKKLIRIELARRKL